MSMLCALFLASLPLAFGQQTPQTCSGQPIVQAQALVSQYPPLNPGQGAYILDGDQTARDLYNQILATNSPFLQIPPTTPNAGGSPILGSYDWHEDADCWWSYTQCTVPKTDQLPPDLYFCGEASTWGLSIDDGPTCAHGPQYDMLADMNQQASLYYIGVNVLSHPEEALKGYNAGHEICAHSWSHKAMTTLTNEQLFAELYYTKNAIKAIIGVSTRCFRPPYGDVDNRVRFFASALDQEVHIWTRDTNDFRVLELGAPAIVGNYESIIADNAHASSGIVVLNHEVNDQVVNLFLQEFPHIRDAFQHVTPVSTCNNHTRLYAEKNTPDYPTFQQYTAGRRYKPWQTTPYSGGQLQYSSGVAADKNPKTTSASAASSSPSTSAFLSTSAPSASSSGVSGAENVDTASRSIQHAPIKTPYQDGVVTSDASLIVASVGLLLPTVIWLLS